MGGGVWGLCFLACFAEGHPEVRHYWRKAPNQQQRLPGFGGVGGGLRCGGSPQVTQGAAP